MLKKRYAFIFVFILFSLFMPYRASAKEWVIQCDYTVYFMRYGDEYEGLKMSAKVYDDDTVDFIDMHTQKVLDDINSEHKIYDQNGNHVMNVPLSTPNRTDYVNASKTASGYVCPRLYKKSHTDSNPSFVISVDKNGLEEDVPENRIFVASEQFMTINTNYSGGEIQTVTLSDECIRKIRTKMGGYNVNLDFYFRMYSDGTKKVCVATEGESNTSCSGTSSGSMSFSHVSQNSHKYNFAITEIQKSKIFVQSSPTQRENNKFTCPESIYIYQTSVFVGSGETNSYYNLTMNEEETRGYNTGSLVVDSGQWEPDIQEPGNPVYGCEVIPLEIRNWIKSALNLVKYVALVLVIVLGALDFIQAAASGEADKMKKAGNSFVKRIIAVVVLFLLPVIVDLILNLIEIYGVDSTCLPD